MYVLDADCTFAGVAFACRETGEFARAEFPTQRAQAIRHVPWGSRTIVQDLGAQAAPLTLRLEVAQGTYPALQAKVMQVGTLALVDAPARSGVLLQSLDNVTVDDAHDLVFVDATFLGIA